MCHSSPRRPFFQCHKHALQKPFSVERLQSQRTFRRDYSLSTQIEKARMKKKVAKLICHKKLILPTDWGKYFQILKEGKIACQSPLPKHVQEDWCCLHCTLKLWICLLWVLVQPSCQDSLVLWYACNSDWCKIRYVCTHVHCSFH